MTMHCHFLAVFDNFPHFVGLSLCLSQGSNVGASFCGEARGENLNFGCSPPQKKKKKKKDPPLSEWPWVKGKNALQKKRATGSNRIVSGIWTCPILRDRPKNQI